jgi:Transposase and inactivated derivatives
MYENIRQYLGEIFRSLALQKECKILEGHVCFDNAHMLIEVPHKHFVSHVAGLIKSKSAIAISRVGRDEETIRQYIQKLDKEDQRLDQLALFKE